MSGQVSRGSAGEYQADEAVEGFVPNEEILEQNNSEEGEEP